MAITSKEQLKSYFETGDYPTEENFGDLIDTMLTREDIEGWNPGTSPGTVDTELSETSMNPLANATITAELKKKVSAEEGKGLSTNDYTNADKSKLARLENYDDTKLKEEIAETYQPKGDYVETKNLATINGKPLNEGGDIEIESGSGGASIEVDSSLSTTSTNPVQNKVIATALTELSAKVGELEEQVPSVFEAVYGVTTYDEIVAAVKAQKHVICFKNDRVYNLNNFGEGRDLNFSCTGEVIYLIKCTTQNKWSSSTLYYELSTYKVTSLSDKSTNTQYPSAKAVYDFVNNTLGTLINGDY